MSNQIVDVFEFKDPKTGKVFTAERHKTRRRGMNLKVLKSIKKTESDTLLSDFRLGRGFTSYIWVIPSWVKSLPTEWEEVK